MSTPNRSKAEEYRRAASLCDEHAQQASDQSHIARYRRSAEQWRDLAEQAERNRW